jgi:hypothetical protein
VVEPQPPARKPTPTGLRPVATPAPKSTPTAKRRPGGGRDRGSTGGEIVDPWAR